MRRSIDTCSYRKPCVDQVRATGGDATGDRAFYCDLLVELTGVKDPSRCSVQRDACEACCQTFPPSKADVNPVVAALLFSLTEEIVAEGGADGCDADLARKLNTWAEKCLPILATPDESDSPPLPELQASDAVEQIVLEDVLPLPRSPQPHSHQPHSPQPHSPAESPSADVRWAVGLTTSPRRLPTIDTCLDSVRQAGWSDVRLFMDDSVDLAERHRSLASSVRTPRLGAWPNYYLSLTELLMRCPGADAYLLLQDDVLFYGHPGLKAYLEKLWLPLREQAALASLFCPRDYTRSEAGWHQLSETWFWGALAFIFSREAAQRFIVDRQVMSHRWHTDYGEGTKGIDVVIGAWAARNDIPIFYPSPSLVQHIGEVSTMWDTARAIGPRRADAFMGDVE